MARASRWGSVALVGLLSVWLGASLIDATVECRNEGGSDGWLEACAAGAPWLSKGLIYIVSFPPCKFQNVVRSCREVKPFP